MLGRNWVSNVKNSFKNNTVKVTEESLEIIVSESCSKYFWIKILFAKYDWITYTYPKIPILSTVNCMFTRVYAIWSFRLAGAKDRDLLSSFMGAE